MGEPEVPVLVVGGSLVGLTASVLLAARRVPHLLVERHRGTAIHPRAASFHQRTLEVFRGVGLQAAVEAAAAREFVQNGALIAVDSLAGRELACFYRSFNEGVEALSPTARLFITQVGLEPLLRTRALELGAEHCYATEMTGCEHLGESGGGGGSAGAGVRVTLRSRDGGAERSLRARYLIAADGAHSGVRRWSGIAMQGRGRFAECLTIYFRADVRALLGGRNLSVVYVNQPGLLGFFRFAIGGDAGFLAVFASFDADGRRQEPDAAPARCAALVRAALGVPPDFAVTIDDVQPWTAAAATAGALRSGPVFLAGDAAHTMPPTGGFGGNTGVADVHNLAWKLALVLAGAAGDALLDTYDAERRPQCQLTVEQAYARYVKRVDASLPAADLAPLLDDASIELGAVYRSAAVLATGAGVDADTATPLLEDPRHPSGRPGTRVPHLWLRRRGEPVSTLDLPDGGFALVAGAGGGAWIAAAEALGGAGAGGGAGASGGAVPLRTCRVAPGGEFEDPAGRLESLLGIGPEGAVVLRPDGVIGWRATAEDPAPRDRLAEVLRRLSCRGA
ncbi:MAG: FAD-dependent monooxygenase [Steroidobacteraceae bacterium]